MLPIGSVPVLFPPDHTLHEVPMSDDEQLVPLTRVRTPPEHINCADVHVVDQPPPQPPHQPPPPLGGVTIVHK